MELRFQDVVPESPCGIVCACILPIISVVAFILFVPAYVQQVDRLHWGLAVNTWTGEVDLKNPYAPGRYWIGFWMDHIIFPSTLNTIEFSDEQPERGVEHLSVLRSRDKDGKQIFLDVSVQYQIAKADVANIYREMTIKYEDIYIAALRDSLSKVGNLFAVQEVWGNYQTVVNMMEAKCKEVLATLHATCWGLQLWAVGLDPQYEQALITTQVRKQAQRTQMATSQHMNLRAQTQVELADFRKDIKIVQADGAAQKFKIERNATANAQKLLTMANAKVLKTVRDLVVPNATAPKMTDAQLTRYQKLIQLETMLDSTFVFHPRQWTRSGSGMSIGTAWTRLRTINAGQSILDKTPEVVAAAEPVAAEMPAVEPSDELEAPAPTETNQGTRRLSINDVALPEL